MHVLFVCNQNQHRSKTAAAIFGDQFSTQSAGLYNAHSLTQKQLAWADVVFVMEDHQRSEIGDRFPTFYLQKRILSLDIPDIYSFGQDELVEQLRKKVNSLIPLATA